MLDGLAHVEGASPHTSEGTARPYGLALSGPWRATGDDAEILDA
jgi:hypothetical protein